MKEIKKKPSKRTESELKRSKKDKEKRRKREVDRNGVASLCRFVNRTRPRKTEKQMNDHKNGREVKHD